MKKTGLIIVLMLVTVPALADCLTDAAKFANEMCGELSKTGGSSVTKSSGVLDVKAEGILMKFLGKAGVEGDMGEMKKTYKNVLREDLGSELQNNRNCRLKMVGIATKQCPNAPNIITAKDIKWPEGKKRYYVETANIRPSCEDDNKKTDLELKIIVENKLVNFEINTVALKARLVDEGKTILVSGKLPIDEGYTSFSNAELRLLSNGKIEAEMEWIWRNARNDVCTGALFISNSIVQRWK